MPKFVLLAALAFVALVAPSAALAQTPPARTLTANGFAQEPVKPENRKSEASIRAAIDAARAKALPRAITDAKRHALELATAAGVTLGTLVGISDGGQGGFGPYTYGSFGPNRYCGNVPNTKTVRRNGRRVRVRVKGTHRVCRFPSTLYTSAGVTFTIS